MIVTRRAVTVLLTVACTAACSSGHGGASVAAPTSTVPRATVLHVSAGQVVHHVDVQFQYAGFLVTLGTSVYDQKQQKLWLGVRYRNIGGTWHDTPDDATLVVGGEHDYLTGESVSVPPGAVVDTTMVTENLEHDPTAHGTVLWGTSEDDQPKIGLNGSSSDVWRPAPIAVDGYAQDGKFAVHVTGAELTAGFLDDDLQAPPGQRVLRVTFDQTTSYKQYQGGFYPEEHLALRAPDGSLVASTHTGGHVSPVSWTEADGNWIEFGVDPAKGPYTLLLNSVSPTSYPPHPELIDQAPVTFGHGDLDLRRVRAGAVLHEPPPVPDLAVAPAPGPKVDEALSVPPVNVAGFVFAPQHLTYDPGAHRVDITGTAALLEQGIGASDALTGDALAVTPTFFPDVALATGGHLFAGSVPDGTPVPPGPPVPVHLVVDAVTTFDADTAGLYLGPSASFASSVPLGRHSGVPVYPPSPSAAAVDAPAATAGPFTVKLVSYRLGLTQQTPPPPGFLQLEVTFAVTAAPDAKPSVYGLGFTPGTQLFRSLPDGYDTQPVADGGVVDLAPGQTKTGTAVFNVPASFGPGRYSFAIRSNDEVLDMPASISETTFGANLGTSPVNVSAVDQ